MVEKTLNQELLTEVGRKAVKLSQKLTWKKAQERWLHGVVLGILESKIGQIEIEYPVSRGKIDFRYGSSNPVLMELAVRSWGHELYSSQNKSELLKLCRIPYTQARKRVLLLLDVSGRDPIPKENLRKSYQDVTAGKGRFERNCVTVIYVHPQSDYSFRWYPTAN